MTKAILINRIANFFLNSGLSSICLIDSRKTFKTTISDLEVTIIEIGNDYFSYLIDGEKECENLEILSLIDLEEIDNMLCDERHNQLEMRNDPNNATWFRGNKKDYCKF